MRPFHLFLLACLLYAARVVAAPAPPDGAPLKPAKDAAVHPLLLKLTSLAAPERAQALQQLDRIADRERVAAALAHALGREDLYCQGAVSYIAASFRDRRLAPYLAETIRVCRGDLRLEAIKATRHIPDTCLVPALLKEGLDSDEIKVHRAAVEGHVDVAYETTFGAAAAALHALTDGKIGTLSLRLGEPSQKQRAELAATWRAWWEANNPKEPKQPGSDIGASRPQEQRTP
jgi:hypothetical protein